MEREQFDLGTITEGRRKSIEATLAPIGTNALTALGEKLFPYHDHPWRHLFLDFVTQNAGSTFFQATSHDGVEIIYCADKDKGIWYLPSSGVGPLTARGLAIMKGIVAKKRK
jgi:hypothetical protein